MSVTFPRHIWSGYPECPTCEVELNWEDGEEGDLYQPPYEGFFWCPKCDRSWGEDGPSSAEYAAEPEGDDFFTN